MRRRIVYFLWNGCTYERSPIGRHFTGSLHTGFDCLFVHRLDSFFCFISYCTIRLYCLLSNTNTYTHDTCCDSPFSLNLSCTSIVWWEECTLPVGSHHARSEQPYSCSAHYSTSQTGQPVSDKRNLVDCMVSPPWLLIWAAGTERAEEVFPTPQVECPHPWYTWWVALSSSL